MITWWLVLISRSSRDSATTGFGKGGYQSLGARLLVMISDRPYRSLTSSRIRLSQVRSAWPPASSARIRLVFAKRTWAPWRTARWPSAWAMCVFPTPTGPDRTEQNYGLAGVQPAQGGKVADLGRGELGGGGEVELLQSDLLLEPCSLQSPLEGDSLAAGDLVLAEEPEEVQMSEFAAVGLGQASVEGLQHARQPQ
ncbi:hypothetical protein PL81_17320 [Streptomyces sp. RSD-27]|nr:hypothetical protein PL81_17320 [Streptomyces sp. RSD-27]